jgi:hypothetical protein
MKKSIVILLFFITLGASAQGNLQYNQSLSLYTGTYIVPAGKVFKIESINIDYSAIPQLSLIDCNVGNQQITNCIYGQLLYLTIDNFNFKLPSKTLSQSLQFFCSQCAAVTSINIAQQTFSLPIWISAGKAINLPASWVHISGIEFNITQ